MKRAIDWARVVIWTFAYIVSYLFVCLLAKTAIISPALLYLAVLAGLQCIS